MVPRAWAISVASVARGSVLDRLMLDTVVSDTPILVPTGVLVMFAYFISNCLDDINVGIAIGEFIGKLNMNFYLLLFCIPLFTAILGMLIPGSTQVKLFGTSIITIIATAGGNPLLAAAMLPCICGANPVVIIISSISILIGLICLYIGKEFGFSSKKQKRINKLYLTNTIWR